MSSGSEAGSYLRLVYHSAYKAQGPFRICSESNEEEGGKSTSADNSVLSRVNWSNVARASRVSSTALSRSVIARAVCQKLPRQL